MPCAYCSAACSTVFPDSRSSSAIWAKDCRCCCWRFDSRFAVYSQGVKLQLRPSEYFGRNILITTSGVCSHAALACSLAEMGNSAVMFSVDYPYESSTIAADFIETAPISDARSGSSSVPATPQRLLKLNH